MSVLIIAEIGVNHNCDLEIGKALIDASKEAGADVVKFQTFKAAKLVTKYAEKTDYQLNTTDKAESHFEMIKKLELDDEMHRSFKEHAGINGLEFLSTGFDQESVAYLQRLGSKFLKVPSGEINNYPLLKSVGEIQKPIFLSTGMATLGEVETAIDLLEVCGTDRSLVTVLHCNTEYPTPVNDVNLSAMVNMGRALNVNFGYSDHTKGIEIPIAAVALGAQVIEKHITLDQKMEGPDHKASIEPDEFRTMVASIRNVESALGDGVKRVTPSEVKNRETVRKSIVAKRSIKKGEIFCEENLTVKRPGSGISPMCWNDLIGREASRDFEEDQQIEL